MRGRRTMVLRCGCCTAFDFRDKHRRKLAEKDMREWPK
jgi:hypothetical protein